MTPIVDPAWRELSAGARDVLVALAAGGPGTGAAIHRRVRGGGEPQTEPTTHRHLSALADRGYVAREREGGGEVHNELTQEGYILIERNVVGVADEIQNPTEV